MCKNVSFRTKPDREDDRVWVEDGLSELQSHLRLWLIFGSMESRGKEGA